MHLDTAPREELIRIIIEYQRRLQLQERDLATVKTQLQDAYYSIEQLTEQLKQLQKQHPSHPPFSTKPSVKKPETENQPRKYRALNAGRKRDVPTAVVKHASSHCPDCGQELFGGWLFSTRQVIDVPLPPASITEHQVFAHWCFSCQKRVVPPLDLSEVVLGSHRVSLRVMSVIATLREHCRLPIQAIQFYLRAFCRLTLSRGEIVRILHAVAHQSHPSYQTLKKQLRESPVVHGDETGWRENGVNGYLWSFSTPTTRYFFYRKSRASPVVREVVGEEFDGVLVSDFYSAYNIYDGDHQRCWVHLLRDIEKLKDWYPEHRQLTEWARDVRILYREAIAYSGPDPQQYSTPRSQRQQRVRDQAWFRDRLLAFCRPYLTAPVPMQTLCKRIEKYQSELFVFLTDPRIPSDNNAAERALRHSVIARKISGGTRSPRGSQTKMILASLFGTWHLQGKNPLEECLSLLTAASTGKLAPAYA